MKLHNVYLTYTNISKKLIITLMASLAAPVMVYKNNT